MRFLGVVFFGGILCLTGCEKQTVGEAAEIPARTTVPSAVEKSAPSPIYGLAYGPYAGMENPTCGPFPRASAMDADLAKLAKVTSRIRIYSCIDPVSKVVSLSKQHSLECLAGCFLGKYDPVNTREMDSLIKTAQEASLKRLVVGNEVVTQNLLSTKRLLAYLQEARQKSRCQVGTAEVWAVWKDHPELAEACDFLVVHAYGYWDNVSVEEAPAYVVKRYNEVCDLYPGKPVILGETGWPSGGPTNGKAVPSPENQQRFIREFVALANLEGIPYYLFEAYDEPWKASQESGVGDKWGAYFLQRDNSLVSPVIDQFPFTVYSDYSLSSRFIPSGWMGDIKFLKFEPACMERPYAGQTCIRLDYLPGPKQWVGVYWQYPENNWGDLPGYRFRGARQLTFWARGQKGGECSQFKIGGINSGKKYRDSLGDISTGVVELGQDWKRFTIKLPEVDLDSVISGFCWVTAPFQDEPMTIFLDEIRFE